MLFRSLFAGSFALSCAAPIPAQDRAVREKIGHALEKARPALMHHLRSMTANAPQPGELGLVLLAAVHHGVDPAEPAMSAAIRRLASSKTPDTYDLALRLMVVEALPEYPDRGKAAADDTARLLRNRSSGAFGYGGGKTGWNLSTTQYAALGLRAAKSVGVAIDDAVWRKMAETVGNNQLDDGGFDYADKNRQSEAYPSMTTAGIAVLAMCRQALCEDRADSELSRRIDRGWSWLRRNADGIGSPYGRWPFYFHYGLERAAILCDVEKVGDVGWYERGAELFVERQLSGGGWISGTEPNLPVGGASAVGSGRSTSFAVLFLKRRFQKVAGPITPHIVTLPAVGPYSKPADVEACTKELIRRGVEAVPDVLRALRSEIEKQRIAAGAALKGIAGQDFGFDPARDAKANAAAIEKAELWHRAFVRKR